MSIEIRATRPDERRRAADVVTTTLMAPLPTDEVWERRGASWQEMPSLTAWDGDRCVGHAGQFPVETVVPGGARLATAAVTRVGVLPTYRRRGIATRLMEDLIAASVRDGHVLMSLRASETGIYGRYGFGLAGDSANLEIDVGRARPLRGVDDAGSFTLLAPDEVLDTIPPVYESVALRRPGVITRPTEAWWTRRFEPVLERSTAAFVVLHRDADGRADGYVHYSTRWNDDRPDDAPTGRGSVHELFGTDDRVELALWQYVLDVDLVTQWRADGRPVDDPVRLAAADHRAVRIRAIDDEQWLRVVDVDTALGRRAYAPAHGSVTIGVQDRLVAANNGSWRITAEGAERTDGDPDVVLDVATLSALFLGGRGWRTAAAIGDVEVADPAAFDVADRLFGVPTAPFCGTFF